MENIFYVFLSILPPLLIFGGIAAIIIYLIVQRVKEKEQETFENRDN